MAGEPSDEWGETVVAYVVAGEPVTQDDLISWCADRLAKFKRPRLVRFVDTLPRNALGKVVKSELPAGLIEPPGFRRTPAFSRVTGHG